jgi:lipopolysaccharide transport system permease protein
MRQSWSKRELLGYWTLREIKVRYKQSLLGILWAIIQPLALAIAYSFVFSYILDVPTNDIPYPIFVFTALVPWTFFASSAAGGIPSIVNQISLVTKTPFPRIIFPIGVLLATLMDYLVAFAIFIGMFVFYQVELSIHVIWWPLLVAVQILLSLGVLLLGSSLIVFFRDIRFLVPLITQLWMYATPIVYPLDLVPEQIRPVYYLNPMVGIIESYRNIFLRGMPPLWLALGLGAIMSLILLIFSMIVFKRLEPHFADII